MTISPHPAARARRLTPFRLAAAIAVICFQSGSIVSPARAESPYDDVSDRIGLSEEKEAGGAFFGLVKSERLTHSRGLAFGVATSSGSAPYRAASYSDYFSYRFSDRMHLNVGLEYRLDAASRSLTGDSGRFSVLPSFSLEYHPGDATLVRLSYESYSPFGSPFGYQNSRRNPFRHF